MCCIQYICIYMYCRFIKTSRHFIAFYRGIICVQFSTAVHEWFCSHWLPSPVEERPS